MNIISEEELVNINPSAFLNLILHIFRFWSSKPTGEKKIVYGLLLGTLEDKTRYIRKIVPLSHSEKRDLEMDDNFMRQARRIDRKEMELNSSLTVIGWYRSSNDGIKFAARDIKNHINFQDVDPLYISLIIDPSIYLEPDQFGFSIFRLKGENYYNMMTDYYKIPWEIEKIEDPYDIIMNFQSYIKNYFLDKPLITEFNE